MKTISELTNADLESRDEKWEKDFFSAFAHSHLILLDESPHKGPDGWPYLFVQTTEEKTAEPTSKVVNWLAERGIGLAVNPQKDVPDYVFTYGMLWNFKERGAFLSELPKMQVGQVKFESGTKIHAGEASKEYLPEYVRVILRSFFADQKLNAVKILVMGKNEHYDLCFSLESLKNPPTVEHRGILEAISWFLPGHYSLMLVSEAGLPTFTQL